MFKSFFERKKKEYQFKKQYYEFVADDLKKRQELGKTPEEIKKQNRLDKIGNKMIVVFSIITICWFVFEMIYKMFVKE